MNLRFSLLQKKKKKWNYSVEEGKYFYEKSKYYLGEGGFTLRKWESNNEELRKFISEKKPPEDSCDVTYVEDSLGTSKKYRKVLGLSWDTFSDEFVYEVGVLAIHGLSLEYTKRNILRVSASFFDPSGFICPVVLQAKLMFKVLCASKTDWDAVVNEELFKKWDTYLRQLESLNMIRVPRFQFKDAREKVVTVDLHGFADSSKDAYAALVYVRVESDGEVMTNLISAKSKIAPAKVVSITKLELLSCVLLSKLLTSVRKAWNKQLVVRRITCWSDSMVALYWITGLRKEWKAWVENRVSLIRENVDTDCWRYVPGELNPADLATRQGNIEELINDRWWLGPLFLRNSEEGWPANLKNEPTPDGCLDEEKKVRGDKVTIVQLSKTEKTINIKKIIDMERFHSFKQLCRVTAYVIRVAKKFIDSLRPGGDNLQVDDLTIEEVQNAEHMWLQVAQENFCKEG